jgi:hypothetical protein
MGLDFLRYRSKTWVLNRIFLNNAYPGLMDYILISRTGPGSIADRSFLDPILSYLPAPTSSDGLFLHYIVKTIR